MLGLPYVVISVLAGMQSFDPAQEMVARSLGMNRLRSFFAVTLPQIKSSVVAGGMALPSSRRWTRPSSRCSSPVASTSR